MTQHNELASLDLLHSLLQPSDLGLVFKGVASGEIDLLLF